MMPPDAAEGAFPFTFSAGPKYYGQMRRLVFQNRSLKLVLCACSILGLSSCGSSDGYVHAITSETHAHVLYDSPTIQKIVAQALQAERDYKDGLRSPEKRRPTFLFGSHPSDPFRKLRADKEPGYDLPGKTRFKILFESDVLM
jgi:hypothetical protein